MIKRFEVSPIAMNDENSTSRLGILSVTIRDKSALYAAYMPYLRNGGLFVATHRSYQLGDEVILILSLMEEPERVPVAGRVVWVTPKAAEGYRTPGVGVQFNDDDGGAMRSRIENYLAGIVEADRPTYTM
jgi:type IV pilus assembly protein PilZ